MASVGTAPADLHVDGANLRAAAAHKRVPAEVMEGIAAVESGYDDNNDVIGDAGEIGEMQIQPSTARFVGCPEPVEVRLHTRGYNQACGARILRWCYDRTHSWARAARCYNRIDLADTSSIRYQKRFYEEVGKQRIYALDMADSSRRDPNGVALVRDEKTVRRGP